MESLISFSYVYRILSSWEQSENYIVIRHEQASATKISVAPWEVNICLHGLKCHSGLQITVYNMFIGEKKKLTIYPALPWN